ncbi:MAG: hypothetical protein AB1428_13015 [Bacteroidota bacterium]
MPIKLWCWCAKYHAESGLLAGYSTDEVEAAVGWWGEAGKFVEAMLKVGLLERNELGFYVHDFTGRNGHIAAFKERAKNAADARWDRIRRQKAEEAAKDAPSNAPSTAQPMLEHCSNDLPNERSEKKLVVDAPRREPANTLRELKDQDFVLRLHDKEFTGWMASIKRLIAVENQGRPRNPFSWTPQTGSFESDMKSLIYKVPDGVKIDILTAAGNVLSEKLNWPDYCELAIKYTIRASQRKRIATPYGFCVAALKKPYEIVSARTDGILSGARA